MTTKTISILSMLVLAGSVNADILRVDHTASPGGNGSSWGNAFDSLTDALAAANSGDQIWVAEGTYTPDTPAGQNATFTIPAGVELYGGFEGNESNINQRNIQAHFTELSGGGILYTIVTLAGNNTIVDGFTLAKGVADSGGVAQSRGSAVLALNVNATLRNLTVQQQISIGGGAIHFTGSTGLLTTIENCTFTQISGDSAITTSSLTVIRDSLFEDIDTDCLILEGTDVQSIIDCTFKDNSASFAPIVVNTGAGAITEIDGCTLDSNTSNSIAGILYNDSGTHELRNSVIRDNQGFTVTGTGGVNVRMDTMPASLRIENCLFTGNTVDGQGGAIRKISDADLDIINSTFAGNSATAAIGAAMTISGGTTRINNSIVYENTTGGNIFDERHSVFAGIGTDIRADRSIIEYLNLGAVQVINDTNSTRLDPLFVDADGPDNTFGTPDDNPRLSPGSPAINAGNNLYVGPFVSADIFGQSRFHDDTGTPDTGVDGGLPPVIDMGAAEFQGTTPNDCVADTNGDGMLTPADFTAWINAFNNNLPECDQNGDGSCTPTDFTAWIANFNAGC